MHKTLKALLLTLLIGVVVFGAAFAAAASLGVDGVANLGSGGDDVLEPSVDVTNVTWGLNSSDYTLIDSVTITFDGSFDGDVYVQLTDGGTPVAWDNGTVTSASTITLYPRDAATNPVTAEEVDDIEITVIE